MLKLIAEGMTEIYGVSNIVHNVYALIHLPLDSLKFGSLDAYNTFPFESYMYSIKR